MDAPRRDAYVRALLGESAQDVDALESNGGKLPPGRTVATFARGGCTGKAWAQVGSIWNLRNAIAPDLERARTQARQTTAFQASVADYTTCVAGHGLTGVDDPGDLEAYGAADPEVIAADADCNAYWVEANRAGLDVVTGDLIAAHRAEVDQQTSRYRTALTQIVNDRAFLAFTEHAMARAGGAAG